MTGGVGNSFSCGEALLILLFRGGGMKPLAEFAGEGRIFKVVFSGGGT